MQKLLVIVGPTASGKTALAVKIAQKYNGEIISADSRQIYRGMDIGTAKPTKKERGLIPHHLIDIKNPDELYTAAEYKRDAISAIRKILKRKRLPILVGGTGLYVRAVIDNLKIPKVKADARLRKKLELEIKREGLKNVYEKLIGLDPEAAYIVDSRNPRRVIRALEILLKTGKPLKENRRIGPPLFDTLIIGLNPDPEKLKSAINKRVDLMIKNGLVDEVKNLIKKYPKNSPVFDAIGYREIMDYLDGKVSLPRAAQNIKINTRHYAKRQMTWFKRGGRTHWAENERQALALLKKLHFQQ